MSDLANILGVGVIGAVVGAAWAWLGWCVSSGGRPYFSAKNRSERNER